MQIIKKEINNIPVTFMKTKKFKTIRGVLNFKSPVTKENLVKRAFLKRLLIYSTNKYKTNEELNLKCLEIYDAYFSSTVRREGIYINNFFSFETLEDCYTEKNNLKETIDTFCEIIFNPNVNKNAFEKDSFEYAKNKIIKSYEKIKEDPREFLAHDILKYLNQDKVYSYDIDLDILNKITEEELYDEYKNMIENSEISIYLVGNIDENDSVFDNIFNNIKSNKKYTESIYISNDDEELKEENIVNNTKGTQSILDVLFYTQGLTEFESNYVMPIYSLILGGGGASRLFDSVREKNSLAYYCFSRFSKDDNILEVITGIDKKNKDKALKLIKQELDNMKEVTDEELITAKTEMISTYIESQDSIASVSNAEFRRDLYNIESEEVLLNNINKVTKEDIEKVSEKIKYKFNYFLEGSDNNE